MVDGFLICSMTQTSLSQQSISFPTLLCRGEQARRAKSGLKSVGMAKNDSDVSSLSLVRVSEGGGWVSDLFYDPNKSLTAITLVSNSSRRICRDGQE